MDGLPFPRRCDGIGRRADRAFLLGLAAALCGFAVWANLTVLDKVKRGTGRVVPQTQNQIVQHFEGGIVTDIFVKEGDRVDQGAPLFRVENSFSRAELSQARLDIKAKQVRLVRLAAQAEGAPDFKPDKALVEGIEAIAEAERAIFATHRQVVAEQAGILEEQLEQKRLELSELKARWTNTTAERELVLRQVLSLRKLADLGAVSSNELLDHERALQQVDSRLSDLTSDIPHAESAAAEIERRRAEFRLTERKDAEKEASDTQLQIAKLEQAAAAMVDRNTRSEVLAPISGAVNKLFVTTRGGVVKSGEPLAQIVPSDASFAVEARLSPSDRAEVFPGLPAIVKISAYD